MIGAYSDQWNDVFAASVMAIVPEVVLFAVIERRVVSSLTAGSVTWPAVVRSVAGESVSAPSRFLIGSGRSWKRGQCARVGVGPVGAGGGPQEKVARHVHTA